MEKEYDRFIDKIPVTRDDSKEAGIRGLIQIAEAVASDKTRPTFMCRVDIVRRYFSAFIQRMKEAKTPVSKNDEDKLWEVLTDMIRDENLDEQ